MGQYTYKVDQIPVREHLQVVDLEKDIPLFLESQEFSVSLDREKDRVKMQIYSLTGELLERVEEGMYPVGTSAPVQDSLNPKFGAVAGGVNLTDIAEIYLDPVLDTTSRYYTEGDVDVLYLFLRDRYTPGRNTHFILESISPDRTELRCYNPELSEEELILGTTSIAEEINQSEFLPEIYLRTSLGQSHTILNSVHVQENGRNYVLFKLYTPLPLSLPEGSLFTVEEEIATPLAYRVEAFYEEIPEPTPYLRGPNFDAGLLEELYDSSSTYSYDELLGDEISNSFYEVRSLVEKQGLGISIDFSDYSNFVHFSSAEERLKSFHHKLGLLENWERLLEESQQHLPGNVQKYKTQISNLLKSMDDYERFLYFEKGDRSWPKQNDTRPYLNYPSNSVEGGVWYNLELARAQLFDETNPHRLTLSIPEYLREDSDNAPYLLFVDMIGNHFDNLWLYSKSFSERYNTDHRMEHGISRDLIRQAVESLGVKLYGASPNTVSLFALFTGENYTSGSEQITEVVKATEGTMHETLQPVSLKRYQQEVYKRIYHNIPLLLKSKGTERSLRTLLNCYGIPSEIMTITQYGGTTRETGRYSGPMEPVYSSENKIRVTQLQEEETGQVLLNSRSINRRLKTYSDDQSTLEVGFNPSLIVWEELKESLGTDFNIDDYIGDPRLERENEYKELNKVVTTLLPSLDLWGIIRLLKFFDNSLFRIIKNFTPIKSNLETGFILSSHPLQRSKQSAPQMEIEEKVLEGEEEVGRIEGSHGESVLGTTSYTFEEESPLGIISTTISDESPKFNGQLEGSVVEVEDGEWNDGNPFKHFNTSSMGYFNDYNPLINNVAENRRSEIARESTGTENFSIPVTGSVWFWENSQPAIQVSTYYSPFPWSAHNGELTMILQWSGSEANFQNFYENYSNYQSITVKYKSDDIPPVLRTLDLRSADRVEFSESEDGGGYVFPEIVYVWNNVGDIPVIAGYEYYEFAWELAALFQTYEGDIEARIETILIPEIEVHREKAQIQDQIYHSTGLNRSKHTGVKTSSKGINLKEDLKGTWGQNPPVEQTGTYFGYITNIEDPYPVINDKTYLKTKYLVDAEGSLQEVKLGERSERDLKELFKKGGKGEIQLTVPTHEQNLERLNKTHTLGRVGEVAVPILYSQNSSVGYQNFIPLVEVGDLPSTVPGNLSYNSFAAGPLNMTVDSLIAESFLPLLKDAVYFTDPVVSASIENPFGNPFDMQTTLREVPEGVRPSEYVLERYGLKYEITHTTGNLSGSLDDRKLLLRVYGSSSLSSGTRYEDIILSEISFTPHMIDISHPLHQRTFPLVDYQTVINTSSSMDSGSVENTPEGVRRNTIEILHGVSTLPLVYGEMEQRTGEEILPSEVNFLEWNYTIELHPGDEISIGKSYSLYWGTTSTTNPAQVYNPGLKTVSSFAEVHIYNLDNTLYNPRLERGTGDFWKFLKYNHTSVERVRRISFWQSATPDPTTLPLETLWYNPTTGKIQQVNENMGGKYWTILVVYPDATDVRFYWEGEYYFWTGKYIPDIEGKLEPAFKKIYFEPLAGTQVYGRGVKQGHVQYFPNNSPRFEGGKEPEGTFLPRPTLPFSIEVGDEIRFENNEKKTFTIVSVEPQYPVPGVGKRLVLELDRAIPYTTNLNFFLIRRYVPSIGNIMIPEVFPYTQTPVVFTDGPDSSGFILPEYPSQELQENIKQITENLLSKELR